MKILFVLLLSITPGLLFSQIERTKLDSIILSNTSKDFFQCLAFERQERNQIWDNEKMAERSKSYPEDASVIEKTVQTYIYGLRNKAGERFFYRMSGYTSSVIRLQVDSLGKIIDPLPFKKIEVVKTINDLRIIPKESAIELAKPHLKNKRVKSPDCRLVYDIDTNLVYWEISSSSGLKYVTKLSVLINAVDKQFIRTEEFKYRRKLL